MKRQLKTVWNNDLLKLHRINICASTLFWDCDLLSTSYIKEVMKIMTYLFVCILQSERVASDFVVCSFLYLFVYIDE